MNKNRIILIGIIIVTLIAIVIVLQSQDHEKNIKKISFIRHTTSVSNNTIIWNSDYKLSVKDFQEMPIEYNNEPSLAISSIGFLLPYFETEVTIDDICHYEIKNYKTQMKFDKSNSWINLKKIKEINILPEVLDHEQRHFDIGEIYSRIINKSINDEFKNKKFTCPDYSESSMENSIIGDAVKRIFPLESALNMKYLEFEDRYEQETGHGFYFPDHTNLMPLEPQKKWNQKIDSCLRLTLNDIHQCFELNSK